MKQLMLLVILVCCSCVKQESKASVVLENEKINPEVIKSLDIPERALLSWYLYAYGNACENNSTKFKCQILKELNINNECNTEHLNYMLQWFSKDILAPYKLKKCPNIASNSAIQNAFEKIVLIKKNDTLSIDYIIKGMNNSQEKSWNFDAVDVYFIEKNNLVKLPNK
tara:strand:+ start:10561 stop:11064 length:504 start_codon:yes stop_codon:yes gene_type:complete